MTITTRKSRRSRKPTTTVRSIVAAPTVASRRASLHGDEIAAQRAEEWRGFLAAAAPALSHVERVLTEMRGCPIPGIDALTVRALVRLAEFQQAPSLLDGERPAERLHVLTQAMAELALAAAPIPYWLHAQQVSATASVIVEADHLAGTVYGLGYLGEDRSREFVAHEIQCAAEEAGVRLAAAA